VGSPDYQAMVVETEGKANQTPPVPQGVFDGLPEDLKPLVRHWVE
jgi:hypothetical protein